MVSNKYTQLSGLLLEVESLMKAADLWVSKPPNKAAFASRAPFCIDTMTVLQWLQFVFLPKLSRLIEQGAALPQTSRILPVVEECLPKQVKNHEQILATIERIDCFLSASDQIPAKF